MTHDNERQGLDQAIEMYGKSHSPHIDLHVAEYFYQAGRAAERAEIREKLESGEISQEIAENFAKLDYGVHYEEGDGSIKVAEIKRIIAAITKILEVI